MTETQTVVEQAVLISNSESSDSLECLFGDEKDVSSRSTAVPTTNPLKEVSHWFVIIRPVLVSL